MSNTNTFTAILDSLIPHNLVEDDPRDVLADGKVPNVMKDKESKKIKAPIFCLKNMGD